ncbi:MAG: glycosyl hydrolase 53 family protein, partial [Acidobacteriaceae bacterium]
GPPRGGGGWGVGAPAGSLILLCCLAAIPALAQRTDLPPKFFLGADTSALDAPTRWPLPPYQEDGKPSDETTILMHHGWTAFRVRVFVSPVRNAPDNTLENAIPLARKIKSAGAILILDLHFSDTWADPQHQEIPVAWRGMDFDELAKQWEKYARDTVRTLKNAGAMPDIVQIGNEITRGAAWPLAQLQVPGSTQYNPPAPYDDAQQWKRLTRLLNAGIRGVRSGAGNTPPRIAIHIDKGGHWDTTEWFFDHLNAAHVPYDIIAESFYPPWGHGTLEELRNNMQECARRYHKDFLVMETGYTPSHAPNNQDMLWPVTPQGRLQFMVDLVNTVRKAPNGLGVLYWAPEHDLWNPDGSPAPAVFTLENLTTLATGPASHAPAVTNP